MKLIKQIVRIGNSAGVILPREWLNGKAKVELVKKPLDIKKDVLEILEPYFEDIIGVYLVGSYARGEKTKESDIDILVITNNINKKIKMGKYEVIITTLNAIVSVLKERPEIIYSKLIDAKVILNKGLLEELKNFIKLNINSFKLYFKDSKKMIGINKELIEMDKLDSSMLKSKAVIYSSLLRLRGLYIIRSILNEKKYSNREFERWLITMLGITKAEYEKLYRIYSLIRDNKKIKEKIDISLAEKLVGLLEREIEEYGKKKKKT